MCVCVCVRVCPCKQVNLQVIVNDNHWNTADGPRWSVNESVAKGMVKAAWILCALHKEGGEEGGERERKMLIESS